MSLCGDEDAVVRRNFSVLKIKSASHTGTGHVYLINLIQLQLEEPSSRTLPHHSGQKVLIRCEIKMPFIKFFNF